jgi:tetratricopeptide (TPR) repeat protein
VEKFISWQRILKNVAILFSLAVLVAAPTPLAGWGNLRRAERASAESHFSIASIEYSLAARRLPWMPALWGHAAQATFSSGDPQAAIPLFARAADHDALSPQGWLAWGDAYQQSGDLASALSTWQTSLLHSDPSVELYTRLARAYRLQGNYLPAQDAWRAALDLDPGDAEAHYQLGLLLAANAPDSALPELMQAAKLDASLDSPVQVLRTNLNSALLVENRAYQLLMSGRALAALGEWDLACEAFRGALLANHNYAEAWAWRGEARQHLGADGLSDLQMALRLDADSPAVHALFGLYWQRQGKADQALASFQKAIALEPANASWQTAAGSAFEQAGDLVAALAYYKQAAALDPQGVETLRALAAFCARYQVEALDAGLPAARRALELAPEDWHSQDVMGQVSQAVGDPSSAERYYLRAVELAPNEAAPYLHLALLYLQLGRAQSAYDNLLKAQKLDPQGSSGLQAGRLLERYFP